MFSRLCSKSVNNVYKSNKFNRLTNKVYIRHFSKEIDPKTALNVTDSSNTIITSSTANDATTTLIDSNSGIDIANGIIENTAPLGLEALGWSPSHLAMSLIENIHLLTGLDYWVAITLGTLTLRALVLPLAISAQRSAGRLKLLKPHMDKLTAKMNVETDKPEKIKEYQAEARALFKKYKVNPFLSFLVPLSQIPVFISFYFGMQSMGDFFPGMATGGTLWFPDLTAPDSSYGLPVVNGIIFAAMSDILVNENTGIGGDPKQQLMMKWGFRGLGVIMIPLLQHCNSGLMVYFITQGACSVVQGIVFMNPAMRKVLDLPKLPRIKSPSSTGPNLMNAKTNDNFVASKFFDYIDSQKSRSEFAKAEILDGTGAPPPPPDIIKSNSNTNSKIIDADFSEKSGDRQVESKINEVKEASNNSNKNGPVLFSNKPKKNKHKKG